MAGKEPEDDDDDVVEDVADDEIIDDPVGEAEETDEHDDESVDDPTGETDDADGHEAEFSEQPKGKQGKAAKTITSLRKRAQEAERKAEAAERRATEALAQANNRQTDEQRRAEEARLQYMTPEEKSAYAAQKQQEANDRRFQQVGFMLADSNDQKSFERECRRNPALDALADQVEEVLAAERAKGLPGAPRAAIARYLLGDKALKAAARKKGTMSKQAAKSREANKASGGSNRSNVRAEGGGRGDDRSKRAKRLENVSL